MNKSTRPPPIEKTIVLKDPALAALLAFVIPGLGHVYQGRPAKGILFFICLMSTFVYGCYLGGSSQVGWARVVYVAWRDDDMRLAYLCQAGIGLPALPALIQANRARNGNEPWWHGFMAPPQPEGSNPDDPAGRALARQPSLDALHFHLRGCFELGTAYTMIAGLLNLLAVYDAWGGPVFPVEAKKEEEEEDEEEQGEGRGKTEEMKNEERAVKNEK